MKEELKLAFILFMSPDVGHERKKIHEHFKRMAQSRH